MKCGKVKAAKEESVRQPGCLRTKFRRHVTLAKRHGGDGVAISQKKDACVPAIETL